MDPLFPSTLLRMLLLCSPIFLISPYKRFTFVHSISLNRGNNRGSDSWSNLSKIIEFKHIELRMKTQASDSRPSEFSHFVILPPCFNPKSDLNWIYLLPCQSGDRDSKTGISLTQNHTMYYIGYYCPVDSTGAQFSIT